LKAKKIILHTIPLGMGGFTSNSTNTYEYYGIPHALNHRDKVTLMSSALLH